MEEAEGRAGCGLLLARVARGSGAGLPTPQRQGVQRHLSAGEESRRRARVQAGTFLFYVLLYFQKPKPENERLRTAAEITTPLAGQPYEAQLSAKQEEAKKTVQSLVRQLKDAKAANARYLRPDALLQPVSSQVFLTVSVCRF